MSWRFMFAFLVLLVAASAWGGLQVGEWLVANGPAAMAAPGRLGEAPVEILDANGKPFAAQPPQPLVDGRLAIPQPPEPVAWEVSADSLNTLFSNNLIAIATTRITMAEAERLAALEGGKLAGIADVGDLISSIEKQGGKPGAMPIQPVDIPEDLLSVAPAANTRASATASNTARNNAWLTDLRNELQVCNAQSFFDRPSCAWAARNRYCTPNNAWGYVAECPAKTY